jgi:predicted RNase H-like HicB family nuclease
VAGVHGPVMRQPVRMGGNGMGMNKITLEIEQLPEGPYLGTSPELPGLVVQADSVQEVLRLAPDLAHDLNAVMVETNQRESRRS